MNSVRNQHFRPSNDSGRLKADEYAARVLEAYWDDDLFPVDPFCIASKMGYGVYLARLPEDVSGMYRSDDGGTKIYIESRDHENRQRFTMGHELGHAVRNPDGQHVDRKRDALAREGTDDEEVFANRFSASLLMPHYAVEKLKRLGWSTHRMANFFGVSNSAMEIRLASLGMA